MVLRWCRLAVVVSAPARYAGPVLIVVRWALSAVAAIRLVPQQQLPAFGVRDGAGCCEGSVTPFVRARPRRIAAVDALAPGARLVIHLPLWTGFVGSCRTSGAT